MKKEEVTKFMEEKGDTSYVIRTEADDKAFLENHKKSVLETELGPAVEKIHSQYDDDLEKIFGERKKPTEKTYNFMKAKFQSLKDRSDKVESLEKEIEDLKKGNPGDANRLKEIKSLQEQIEKLKQDHEVEIKELGKKNLKAQVKGEIERGLIEIKIKAGIPDSVKQIYVNQVISDLSDSAEYRDGQLVFLDKDGKAMRNPQTMAPYTAAEILKERMKDVVDMGRKMEGPGFDDKTKKPFTKDKDGKLEFNFVLPDSVKDRGQLGEYLVKELGIKNGTPEYREAYKKYGENLPAPKF